MQGNNQFFAVFGSGGSSSGGSGVSGSGTLNYLAKWTPDGSTIGDSQIQDNGTRLFIGSEETTVQFHILNSSLPINLGLSNTYTGGDAYALETNVASSNTNTNYGIKVSSTNSGSGNAFGIYESAGAFNWFEGNTGIGVTPVGSEAVLSVKDTRNTNLPAIYGFNSTQSYAQGVQGAVGDNVDNTNIDLATEGLVGVFGRVNTTNSAGTDFGIYGSVTSSSNNHLNLFGAKGRVLYTGTTTTRDITGGAFESNVDGASAQVLNAFGIDVDTYTTNTATIGTHYGIRVQMRTQTGTPSITTSYGLYLDSSNANYVSGTSSLFGIYQNGGSAKNFLDGNVGIGTNSIGTAIKVTISGSSAIRDGINLSTAYTGATANYGIKITHSPTGSADATGLRSVVDTSTGKKIGIDSYIGATTSLPTGDIGIASYCGNADRDNYSYWGKISASNTNNNYGLYLDVANAGSGSAYGVYQVGASALNYLQGNLGVGNTPVSSSRIKIAGADASTSAIQIVSSSATDVSSPNDGDLWYNGTNLYFYNGTSNTDLLAGGGGGNTGTTTVKEYDSIADIDLYNDGNIRIGWDVSGSDIEAEVLTNPSTGRVNFVATVGGVITSVDGLTTTTPADLDSGFGNDESMYILINAPDDTTYPAYKIELKKSNNTWYTNTPFLVIATKYTSYD